MRGLSSYLACKILVPTRSSNLHHTPWEGRFLTIGPPKQSSILSIFNAGTKYISIIMRSCYTCNSATFVCLTISGRHFLFYWFIHENLLHFNFYQMSFSWSGLLLPVHMPAVRGLTGERSCWNSNSSPRVLTWTRCQALNSALSHVIPFDPHNPCATVWNRHCYYSHFQMRNRDADTWKPKVTQLVSGGIEIWILICPVPRLKWMNKWLMGSWVPEKVLSSEPPLYVLVLTSQCLQCLESAHRRHSSQGPFFAGSNPVAVPSFHGKVAFLNLLF